MHASGAQSHEAIRTGGSRKICLARRWRRQRRITKLFVKSQHAIRQRESWRNFFQSNIRLFVSQRLRELFWWTRPQFLFKGVFLINGWLNCIAFHTDGLSRNGKVTHLLPCWPIEYFIVHVCTLCRKLTLNDGGPMFLLRKERLPSRKTLHQQTRRSKKNKERSRRHSFLSVLLDNATEVG